MTAEPNGPEVHLRQRPYGCQEILTLNTETSVKVITVNPGESLSLHRHQYRDEWWTILDGALDVLVDGRRWTSAQGERIWIPREVAHGLRNPGTVPGRFLELAFGVFDEADIERLTDVRPVTQ